MLCNVTLSKNQKQFGKFFCVVVIVLVIALVVDLSKSNGSHHTATLKFVLVIARHGARAPIVGYPNDPYFSKQHWPEGQGGLTAVGIRQLYNLGITLRKLYDGFINSHYLSSEFRAFSSLVDRTLQSAESLIAGLYPPKDYQVWNEHVDWQPIPVYPNYNDKDILFMRAELCPRFWQLQNNSVDAVELELDHTNETETIIQHINLFSGLNGTKISELLAVWDALACEKGNGLKLPEWTASVFPSPFDKYVNKYIRARLVGNEQMTRLFGGPMIQTLVSYLQKKLNDTENKQYNMVYFSTHDNTIKGILATLGFENSPIMPFAETLLLELHVHPVLPSGHEIKLFQIDGESEDRTPLQYEIPNCTSSCDFNRFLELTKKYYDGLDWAKECQL